MEHTDEELFSNYIKNGDESSFEVLMKKYADKLVSYIKGYIADPSSAEDVMIESFSKMIVTSPKLNEGGFKAYLYKIARNEVFHFNKQFRQVTIFSIDEDNLDLPDGSESLDEYFADVESDREMKDILNLLKPEYKEVLYLKYFECLTVAEICKIVKKTNKQVENLLSRGRESLRGLIQKRREEN